MKATLNVFKTGDFTQNALNFFEKLGYNTQFQQSLTQKTYAGFESEFTPLNETNALVSEWIYVDQLFFLTPENTTLEALKVENVNMDAYLIFGIELKKSHYSRGDLVKITREFNRVFPRPVLILFKHCDAITLSVINRRIHKRDDNRDVLEKVTLIKDIRLENTHRAHLDILNELAFSNLKPEPQNFVDLHNAWQKVLNTKTLNKDFYEKLFDWYLFALSEVKVKFPQMRPEADVIPDEQHQSESLIRLLTRLLFVWFMKEKGLINAELFEPKALATILKNFTGENSNDTIFYKAILQNLFFATLNMPIEKRKVIYDGFAPSDYGNQLVYRYAELFNDADFDKHFENIPFLNGGLFDCLDQRKTDDSPEIRLDGFSSTKSKQAIAPDKLFFGEYKNVNLSAAYDNKKKSNVTVYGLITILQNHKFTVEENTPLEEDIALDPELLGQVFENLLAAYNPETGTTARKQTGSFYTPREIVDYMVDESLIAYFQAPPPLPPLQRGDEQFPNSINSTMEDSPHFGGGQGGGALRELLNYENSGNPFDPQQTTALIQAIDNLKILDPACGSGAFPMGILHKLVFVLSKLDPKNEKWRELQKQKAIRETDAAFNLGDHEQRATRLKEINDAFDYNASGYGRKLFLIENCIHGVDIQPIATQISKLRFFISLIVDQKSDKEKPNFGIRALPNLDFKIIAANTLIAAPQDDEAMGVKVEDEFFTTFSDLTHHYFNVSTPDEKKKLRTKIETLINAKCDEKIKNVQRLTGINEIKNKKIIEHSQNDIKLWQSYANLFKHEAVAFFEPRYFFPQLSGGFDIVIGNPPYIDSETMVKNNPRFREYLKSKFISAEGNWDIFVVFSEMGLNLCKPFGSLAFIVPNKIISAKYTSALRAIICKLSPYEIIDYSYVDVFKEADVYPVVILISNQKTYDYQVKTKVMESLETVKTLNLVSSSQFISDIFWDKYFFNTDELNLIIKITLNDKLKNKFPSILGAATVNEAYKIKEFLKELGKEDKYFKFINTGTIDPYKTLWGIKKTQYIKGNYQNPILNKDDLQEINITRLKQAGSPKIIIAGMSLRIEAFLDEDGQYCAGKSTVIILDELQNLKTLIGILNSKLVSFWFSKYFNSLSMAGGYFNVGNNEIGLIPIPNLNYPIITINTLVDKILAEKKAGNDTSALEREIDLLVYALYGLSEEEILIVEGGK